MTWEAPELNMGPGDRDYGVIVTVQNQETGRLHSLHESGGAIDAVGRACDRIDEMGDAWKIVSVSSPRSVFRDLQGTRAKQEYKGSGSGPKKRKDGGDREFVEDPRTYEIFILSRVRRLDLLKKAELRHAHLPVSLGAKRTDRQGRKDLV